MGVVNEASLPLTRHPDLVLVLDTPKGRGVFASAPIPAHTILETCPVIVLDPQENKQHIEKTELFHYTYNWPTTTSTGHPLTTQAVILGLGSMFNHSTTCQNVGWERDLQRLVVTYKTLRDIQEGEELCISYGARLTFTDADAPEPTDEGDGAELLGNIYFDTDVSSSSSSEDWNVDEKNGDWSVDRDREEDDDWDEAKGKSGDRNGIEGERVLD